jgi:hypothetical protein
VSRARQILPAFFMTMAVSIAIERQTQKVIFYPQKMPAGKSLATFGFMPASLFNRLNSSLKTEA